MVFVAIIFLASPSPLFAADTLRTLADQRGLRFGCAVEIRPVEVEAAYQNVVNRECNTITPANSLKFDIVHPSAASYDFTEADKILAFAKKNGQAMRGHTLVWDQALPRWLTQKNRSRDEAIAILRDHIYKVVGHYQGQFYALDVLNEAVGDDGNLKKSYWLGTIGQDYVALSFQWAREADPTASLCYNDYDGEGLGAKSDGIYRLLSELKIQGAPVDCVGLEMHLNGSVPPNFGDVTANMKRLSALGLQVHITELDVRLEKPFTEAKLATQADIYRSALKSCLGEPACSSFGMWGITDKYSWVTRVFKNWGSALIFDGKYNPKPAYFALINTFLGN